MCGFLFKKGGSKAALSGSRGRRKWSKRWFHLEGGYLSYFKTNKMCGACTGVSLCEVCSKVRRVHYLIEIGLIVGSQQKVLKGSLKCKSSCLLNSLKTQEKSSGWVFLRRVAPGCRFVVKTEGREMECAASTWAEAYSWIDKINRSARTSVAVETLSPEKEKG